jgi:hypothetical protein
VSEISCQYPINTGNKKAEAAMPDSQKKMILSVLRLLMAFQLT